MSAISRNKIITATVADLAIELERKRKVDALVNGLIHFEVEKPNKKIRNHGISFNAVTTFGFNLMLDSLFRNGALTSGVSIFPNWYIGLISPTSWNAGLSVGDTLSSHSGWTEDTTHYDGGARPQWNPAAASGKSISNTSSTNFPINSDNTVIKGIFIVSDSVYVNATAFLFSEGLFGSDQTLYNHDTLKITYVVNLN